VGGNRYTESIQKMLGLSYDQAETLKLGTEVDGRTIRDAQPAIDMVNAEWRRDPTLLRLLPFLVPQRHHPSGCAQRPAPRGSRPRRIPFGKPRDSLRGRQSLAEAQGRPKKIDPAYLEMIAPQLAVSVGLALRQAGDKYMIKINLLRAKSEDGTPRSTPSSSWPAWRVWSPSSPWGTVGSG